VTAPGFNAKTPVVATLSALRWSTPPFHLQRNFRPGQQRVAPSRHKDGAGNGPQRR